MIVLIESGTVGKTGEEEIGDTVQVSLQDCNGNEIFEKGVIVEVLDEQR